MAALAVGSAPQAVAAKKKSPNVVVIFMDDMAYADIGPFGAKAYPRRTSIAWPRRGANSPTFT